MDEVSLAQRRARRTRFVATWTFSVVVGWSLVVWSVIDVAARWSTMEFTGVFLLLAVLVVSAELLPIVAGRFDGEPVSIAQAFVFAALYVWCPDPGPGVLLMAGSILLGELIAGKELWKLLFNVGQYTISVAAAAMLLSQTHFHAREVTLNMTVMVALSWVVYHLVNLGLVAGVAGPDRSWWDDFHEGFWFYTVSTLAVLALSPLVAIVAVAGGETGSTWLLLPLILIPLIAVQRSAGLSQERAHRAMHDPLTGLPNRNLLNDRIHSALTHSKSSDGRVVVLFLDLDQFKTINDGLGHAVGDALLVDVAHRLRALVRHGDTLARFSGDEFAFVLPSVPDSEIPDLPARVQEVFREPFLFEAHEVTITASIGVATATPYSTAQSLLREADSAMYRAKAAGRDQVAYFHWTMHEAATARLDDQLGLRRALERDELVTHYQPVIDLSTGRVLGMEALIRWQHPERGLLSPDEFIPLAEESGLIVQLGTWILNDAVRQLAQWRRDIPGATRVWMAVNLSARQLSDPRLVTSVADVLRESALPADKLHLEITETAVMQTTDHSMSTLNALRDLGVHLIIDDFGTGYSSLARLKRLPVGALKIDRSFVDGLGSESSDLSIVDAITNLARSMDLDVIAEGVENHNQLSLLHDLGVDMGQGYLWSRPLPASGVVDWVCQTMSPADLARFRALLRRG